MSSSQSLREFIRERLSAAAEEIFSEFDKTIVHYEEELDRQRRLLEICCKPQINLQRIVLPQHYVWKEEEVPTDHHFNSLERNSILDQEEPHPFITNEELGKTEPQQIEEIWAELEPTQIQQEHEEPEQLAIKTEQEELYISLEKEQLEQQQSTGFREPRSYKDQLTSLISSESEKQKQETSNLEDSGSTRYEGNKSLQQIRGDVEDVDSTEAETQETVHRNSISACEVCGKSFSLSYLTDHMRIHTGEKRFSCLTCGKNFSKRTGLYQHTKTHTGEKPFSCLTCGKNFTFKASLSRHIRVHTGEKPFSCLTCGRNFSDRASLSRHTKIHTGDKPFSCMTCGKHFIQRSHLTTHMITHHGEQM